MQVTLDCLHQMFDSAKDIMQWLSLCARVVAKADKAVQWTTPLGLPVVQPYRKKVHHHTACDTDFCMQCMVASYKHIDTPALSRYSKFKLELSVHKPQSLPACAMLHRDHRMLSTTACQGTDRINRLQAALCLTNPVYGSARLTYGWCIWQCKG